MEELKNITIEEAAEILTYVCDDLEDKEEYLDSIELGIIWLKNKINDAIYNLKDEIDENYTKQHKRVDSDDEYDDIVHETYNINSYCNDITKKLKMVNQLTEIYNKIKGDN